MSGSASQPAIDLGQLARYTGGDADIDAEVLELFGRQAEAAVERLGSLLSASDSKAWRETAHGLKGAALAMGAGRLGEAAARAEALDPARDPAAAADALQSLQAQSRGVEEFVSAWLAAREPAGTP